MSNKLSLLREIARDRHVYNIITATRGPDTPYNDAFYYFKRVMTSRLRVMIGAGEGERHHPITPFNVARTYASIFTLYMVDDEKRSSLLHYLQHLYHGFEGLRNLVTDITVEQSHEIHLLQRLSRTLYAVCVYRTKAKRWSALKEALWAFYELHTWEGDLEALPDWGKDEGETANV